MILALSRGLFIESETTPVIVWVWEKEKEQINKKRILNI
jgi:hypothetical protein